jgi:hypothetical protein
MASAQGIVLESYTGKRDRDMTRMLAPFHEVLAGRFYASGDMLARRYEGMASRPASVGEGIPADFEGRIEKGHNAWIAGRFDEAIAVLGPALYGAHANAALFAQNKKLRDLVLKGLVALALAQQRKGEISDARETLAEVRRSFPDAQLSRAIYGPEAVKLFDEVRRAQGEQGRGRLTVKVGAESNVIFINERFENVGGVSKDDVIPGTYRIYTQLGKEVSRVHRVEVRANETATLTVDLAYDRTVRTEGFSGLLFASAEERTRNEARYALTFAREVKAASVIVVGIDYTNGRPEIVGSLLDIQNGRPLRRASLALEPEPSADRIRSLARFLAGGQAADDIQVQVREAESPAVHEESPSSATGTAGGSRTKLWFGLGAIGAGLVGGALTYKFIGDAGDFGDELNRVCAVSCTANQARTLEDNQDSANRYAIVSGVAGGVAVVTGVVLIVLWRRDRPSPTVALAPTSGGSIASLSWQF